MLLVSSRVLSPVEAKGGADELEGGQGQADDEAMIGVFDGAILGIAERGADSPHGRFSAALATHRPD